MSSLREPAYCLGRVGRCFASRVAAEERVWSTPVEILTARRVSIDDDLNVDAMHLEFV